MGIDRGSTGDPPIEAPGLGTAAAQNENSLVNRGPESPRESR
jgi:hypothetical protein